MAGFGSSRSSGNRSVGSTSASVDLTQNDASAPSVTSEAAASQDAFSFSGQGAHLSENGIHITASPTDIDLYLTSAEKRFQQVIRAIVTIQSQKRMLPCKRLFTRKRVLLLKLQKFAKRVLWKISLNRRIIHKRMMKRLKNIILLQSVCRMHLARRWFLKLKWLAVKLQSISRRIKQRNQFLYLRRRFVKLQGLIRGVQTRLRTSALLAGLYSRCREQCLYLWALEQTDLSYRSMFWTMVDKPSFMNVALYEEVKLLFKYELFILISFLFHT